MPLQCGLEKEVIRFVFPQRWQRFLKGKKLRLEVEDQSSNQKRLWHHGPPQSPSITVCAISMGTELALWMWHVLALDSISSGLATCVGPSVKENSSYIGNRATIHWLHRNAKLLFSLVVPLMIHGDLFAIFLTVAWAHFRAWLASAWC